jgi:hypothetical protein
MSAIAAAGWVRGEYNGLFGHKKTGGLESEQAAALGRFARTRAKTIRRNAVFN